MIALKFLAADGRGRYSGYAWPLPVAGRPGPWVEASGPLEPGRVGIHALEPGELAHWLDDGLWRIELGGRVRRVERILVAERGRLLERIEAWDAAAAFDLAVGCALRTRERAAAVLAEAGRGEAAATLHATTDLEQLLALATSLAADGDRRVARALAFVEDLAGDALEALRDDRANGGAAAWAACACDEAVQGARALAGAAAAQAERAGQSAWLAARLSL